MADVVGGRAAPMNEEQRKEAVKTVVGEFSDVKHVRGILSMGRYLFEAVSWQNYFISFSYGVFYWIFSKKLIVGLMV